MDSLTVSTVRSATTDDAERIAELSAQFGYTSTTAETVRRLREISEDNEHAVFVADDGKTLLGWIHVYMCHLLVADTPAEISGLVIDEQHRRQGIGRLLMEHVERWAREKGCRAVRLRSNISRLGAHSFYESLGYRITKSQKVFCKDLDA